MIQTTPKPTQTQTTPSITNSSTHQDIQGQRLKNVTTKGVNPLFFKDPIDRQAASLAKIQRIMANPHYQKMKPEQQEKLRGNYFDKYVQPLYNAQTFPVDKATWVKGVATSKFGPDSYYETHATQMVNRLSMSAEKSVGDIFHGSLTAGIWMSKEASMAQLGLNHFFEHASGTQIAKDKESLDDSAKRAQAVVDRISSDTITDTNFWFQTHPNKTLAEKADSFIGEQIVQLPLYEGVGLLRAAGNVGKIANLTEWLGKSAVGKIAATTLGNAADGFMGSILQGQSPEEARTNAAWFAGLGAAGKTLSVASSAIMKKFAANVIAVGGKPLAEAATNQAVHELENNTHSVDSLAEHIKNDPVKGKTVTAYKAFLNSIAQTNFQKPFKDLSSAEKSRVRALHADIHGAATRELPVHVPEIANNNTKVGIEADRKLNPQLDALAKQLEAKGVNFTTEAQNAEKNAVEKQTGIKSSQGTTKKIGTTSRKVTEAQSKALATAQEQEPRKFAQMKVDHMAYFKNPAKKTFAEARKFDYKNWLEGMDSKDFLSELKAHLGNDWWFENPQHMLEYALTYRHDMPHAFSARIQSELKDIDPEGNMKTWLDAGRKRDKHLENMAITGRLYSEGNIFRSSRFSEGQRATKWQTKLDREAKAVKANEKAELKAKMGAAAKHYPQANAISQKILSDLQDNMGDE